MKKAEKKIILSVSQTEKNILDMIRSLDLFDSIEIKYSKQGELLWTLTKKQRGIYNINLHADGSVL